MIHIIAALAVACVPCPDVNGDGAVDANDVSQVLFDLGTGDSDANCDGVTDANDISFVMFSIGEVPACGQGGSVAGFSGLQLTHNNDSVVFADGSGTAYFNVESMLGEFDNNGVGSGGPPMLCVLFRKDEDWAGGAEIFAIRRKTDNEYIIRASASDANTIAITLNVDGTNNRFSQVSPALDVENGELAMLCIWLDMTNQDCDVRLYTSGDASPAANGVTVDQTTIAQDSSNEYQMYLGRRPSGNAAAKNTYLALAIRQGPATASAFATWADAVWDNGNPADITHAMLTNPTTATRRAVSAAEVLLAGPAPLTYALGKATNSSDYGTIGSVADETNTTFYLRDGVAERAGFNDPIDGVGSTGGSIVQGSTDTMSWVEVAAGTYDNYTLQRLAAPLESNEVSNPIVERSATAPAFRKWARRAAPSGLAMIGWSEQSRVTWQRSSNDGADDFRNSGIPNVAAYLDAEEGICGGVWMVPPYADKDADGTAGATWEEAAAGGRFLFNFRSGAYTGANDTLTNDTGSLHNIDSNWTRFGCGKHAATNTPSNLADPFIIVASDEMHQAIRPVASGNPCSWDRQITAAIGYLHFPGAGDYEFERGISANSTADTRSNETSTGTDTSADTSVQSHTINTTNDDITDITVPILQGDYSGTIVPGMAIVNTTQRCVSKVTAVSHAAGDTTITLDSDATTGWTDGDWALSNGDQLEFGYVYPKLHTMTLPAAGDSSTWRTIGVKMTNGFGIWDNMGAWGASGFVHGAVGTGGVGIIGSAGQSLWEDVWPGLHIAQAQSYTGRSILAQWITLYRDAMAGSASFVFAPSGAGADHDDLFADIRAVVANAEIIVWYPPYRMDTAGESEDTSQNSWRNTVYASTDGRDVVVSTLTESAVGDGPQQLLSGMAQSAGAHSSYIGAEAHLESLAEYTVSSGLARDGGGSRSRARTRNR